jgi:predicted secreted acid phosphatase
MTIFKAKAIFTQLTDIELLDDYTLQKQSLSHCKNVQAKSEFPDQWDDWVNAQEKSVENFEAEIVKRGLSLGLREDD